MNSTQQAQLNVLLKLDEVCRKHGLTYYLACGSCLGAVREKGFIPWDHDIDVYMPVADTRKLPDLQAEFGEDLFVRTKDTEPSYGKIKIEIVDRTKKVRVTKGEQDLGTYDLCIDIYPLYRCPEGKAALTLNVWRSHMLKLLVGGAPKNHGTLSKVISKVIIALISIGGKERKIKRLEDKLDYQGESSSVSIYYGGEVSLCNTFTYDASWFAEPSTLSFEGLSFAGPTDVEHYLTIRYGPNYMVPLPPDKRQNEMSSELIE